VPRSRRADTPEDHVLVLFGATGDLAKRLLLPGFFHLAAAGLMPRSWRLIGSAPPGEAMTDGEFREHAFASVREFGGHAPKGSRWEPFADNVTFAAADAKDASALVKAVRKAEKAIGGKPRRLYHLAVPPPAFPSMVEMLGETGLDERARIVVEKPFGTDLESARALNATISSVFDESQVFRIDHFLGKESVENIFAFRFLNGLFEPVWNRVHVDHVQIDVPESLSIEGRSTFYEATGAFRDMVVTHLFQVLGFVAMEPPTAFDQRQLRDEKIKVFEALEPIDPKHVVRGQYEGYRREPGVASRSQTETFVALRVEVENWRWHGVPFYLRTGKSLAEQRQVITLGFRRPPVTMFRRLNVGGSLGTRNEIVIDFADPGSITIGFLAKQPGVAYDVGPARLTFRYDESFRTRHGLEGYEQLVYDAMIGDQTLFTRADGIERLWEVATPLLENPPPPQLYAPGSWGPDSTKELIAPRRWHLRDQRS
jgi:glucose-6-phosphate 1-dehydrogenase